MGDKELFLLSMASASVVVPNIVASGKIVHDQIKYGLSLEDCVERNAKFAGLAYLASSLLSAGVIEYKSKDFGVPSTLHLTVPMSFLSGYFAYYCANLLGRLNRPWIKNVPKYLLFNVKGILKINSIQDESVLSLQRTVFRDPSRLELDYSQRLLDDCVDYNDFLDLYKNNVEKLKLSKQGLDDRITRNIANNIVGLWSRFNRNKFSLLLSRANSYLINGDLADFNICWNKLMSSRNKDNFIPVRVAQVMTYEAVVSRNPGLEHELNACWNDLVREVFENNPERYLEDVEGKKVYRINMYDSLKSMLVLLEGKESDLKEQMNNLLAIDKFLDKSKHQVARPLRVINYQGRTFLAEQHVKGERLTEFLECNPNQSVLERALEFTAVVHARLPVKQLRMDYFAYLRGKLNSSSISDVLKSSILDNIGVVLSHFNDGNVVFDRDSHTDNYHVYNDVIFGYDLPSRGCTHKEMDVSKMVNRGAFFSRDSQGVERKIVCLLNGYLHNYQRFVGASENEDNFVVRCLNATAFKAVTYFLFVHSDYRLKMPCAVDFLENALVDLDEVLDRYRSVNQDEISQYKCLMSCIKELVVIGKCN